MDPRLLEVGLIRPRGSVGCSVGWENVFAASVGGVELHRLGRLGPCWVDGESFRCITGLGGGNGIVGFEVALLLDSVQVLFRGG